ncbi:putative beta-lysine N-acetyltransferase [Halalkalibacter krulwichiae]|uniref:N-acetyltransferase YodP n=1 Tax=Halalkalibacter krulwichiae TaxID=199441 RepID=A0A1X9MDE5_9BACI|nr:putative beta-lysine N-acetyltransferase [Halalkalibacter krulwichiae]ARK30570.1 N-acetyltransferase YodP [Halalkalibacter krulwichiae]
MGKRGEVKILSNETFTVQLYLDYFNERLRVDDYRGNIKKVLEAIEPILIENQFSKCIFHSRAEHWKLLLSYGFQLEAIFSGYFNGSDNYAMTLYKDQERRKSDVWVKEDEILESVMKKGKNQELKRTPEDYVFRRAVEKDAGKLATLYRTVFSIYPTPMDEEEYVLKMLRTTSIFYIVEYNNEIVSAASADINKSFHHAELTDCATLPTYRKYGLMKKILVKLEEELRREHIFCTFSIARALSFGMNAAFYQLGYTYTGRMTNNCYIYDNLEDMNVWVKNLAT